MRNSPWSNIIINNNNNLHTDPIYQHTNKQTNRQTNFTTMRDRNRDYSYWDPPLGDTFYVDDILRQHTLNDTLYNNNVTLYIIYKDTTKFWFERRKDPKSIKTDSINKTNHKECHYLSIHLIIWVFLCGLISNRTHSFWDWDGGALYLVYLMLVFSACAIRLSLSLWCLYHGWIPRRLSICNVMVS